MHLTSNHFGQESPTMNTSKGSHFTMLVSTLNLRTVSLWVFENIRIKIHFSYPC